MYEFTLPLSGKKISWKPLNVKQQLDSAVMYQGNQRIYMQAALYADRICKYQADSGEKPSCSLIEIGLWDEIDYNAFTEEVDRIERERAAAYKKPQPPGAISVQCQKAAMDFRNSLTEFLKVLDETVEAAKALEVASKSPLSAGSSSMPPVM